MANTSELDVEVTSSILAVTTTTSILSLDTIPLDYVLSVGVLVESNSEQVTSTVN